MAKSKKEYKESADLNSSIEQLDRAVDAISTIRDTWEDKEAMLLGSLEDSESDSTKSQVFVPELSNILIERAARVMGQNPTGKVQAMTKMDTGKNMLMNLLIQNYVVPNANNQRPLLVKSRMWDVYSNVYGSYGALVDYFVGKDYTGPDFTLIPIRNILPQVGKSSIHECEYVFVRSVVSKKWLLERDTKYWKNIDKLLERTQNVREDTTYDSYADTKFGKNDLVNAERNDHEQIEIFTRYEKDRWVTFSKDGKTIIRDIENPQKNGKLPIVVKDSFPLIDRFFGLGEFERGQSLQYALNSLVNLYLDGVKMSIFPPLKIDLTNVVPRSIKMESAAKWIMKNGRMDAVAQMQLSPQGLNTFQSTYNFLKASIMNLGGTTDTAVAHSNDPMQGKTPQALKMQAAREASRDNWDRFMMEQALEETYDRFVDLLATRQEKPIKLHLFKEELDAISKINPDVVDMFQSGKYGEVVIKPGDVNDTSYKFFIDAGSTAKQDEAVENEAITSTLALVLKIPGAMEQATKTGVVMVGKKVIDIGEALQKFIMTSGTKNADKIIREATPDEVLALQQQMQPPQPQVDPAMMAQGQAPMPQQMPQMAPQMQQPAPMPQPMPQQGQQGVLSPESQQILAELQARG